MATTRLERKGRKNKNVAKNRVAAIKRLNAVPAVRNIDIDAIKEVFAKQFKEKTTAKKKSNDAKTKVEKASKVETKKVKPKEAPKAKKATTPKKKTKEEVSKKEATDKKK